VAVPKRILSLPVALEVCRHEHGTHWRTGSGNQHQHQLSPAQPRARVVPPRLPLETAQRKNSRVADGRGGGKPWAYGKFYPPCSRRWCQLVLDHHRRFVPVDIRVVVFWLRRALEVDSSSGKCMGEMLFRSVPLEMILWAISVHIHGLLVMEVRVAHVAHPPHLGHTPLFPSHQANSGFRLKLPIRQRVYLRHSDVVRCPDGTFSPASLNAFLRFLSSLLLQFPLSSNISSYFSEWPKQRIFGQRISSQ
jgi:hypothetical protein